MKKIEYTTDLEVIRNKPHLYTWGKIVNFHEIGSIVIVETEEEENRSNFHVYVNGKDKCRSASTLENALMYALVISKISEPCRTNEASWMYLSIQKLLKPEY